VADQFIYQNVDSEASGVGFDTCIVAVITVVFEIAKGRHASMSMKAMVAIFGLLFCIKSRSAEHPFALK